MAHSSRAHVERGQGLAGGRLGRLPTVPYVFQPLCILSVLKRAGHLFIFCFVPATNTAYHFSADSRM